MDKSMSCALVMVTIMLCVLSENGGEATVLTVMNNCKETVWPGVVPCETMENGGFELQPSQTQTLNPPPGWSGRLWGRTGCSFDQTGLGTCQTGDCGNSLKCNNAGGDPPVSLVEFTLGSDRDFYDVSLVDGFNLPVSVVPSGGTGNCSAAGECVADLRESCPPELAIHDDYGNVIACRSACAAFNSEEYCCTGQYGNPSTCLATTYSKIFKAACPTAYSYAYDDRSSLRTCTAAAEYAITFCPGANQTKQGCSSYKKGSKCNNANNVGSLFHVTFWGYILSFSVQFTIFSLVLSIFL